MQTVYICQNEKSELAVAEKFYLQHELLRLDFCIIEDCVTVSCAHAVSFFITQYNKEFLNSKVRGGNTVPYKYIP